jgi:hypothetical protein
MGKFGTAAVGEAPRGASPTATNSVRGDNYPDTGGSCYGICTKIDIPKVPIVKLIKTQRHVDFLEKLNPKDIKSLKIRR